MKKEFIDRKDFDPDGFFFITYRSSPIGLALALPDTETEGSYKIPFLTAIPKYYGKGVESCLMALVLTYLIKKGAKSVSF